MKEEAPQIFGVGSEKKKGINKAFEQACKLGRGYRCVCGGMKKEWRGVDGRGKVKQWQE